MERPSFIFFLPCRAWMSSYFLHDSRANPHCWQFTFLSCYPSFSSLPPFVLYMYFVPVCHLGLPCIVRQFLLYFSFFLCRGFPSGTRPVAPCVFFLQLTISFFLPRMVLSMFCFFSSAIIYTRLRLNKGSSTDPNPRSRSFPMSSSTTTTLYQSAIRHDDTASTSASSVSHITINIYDFSFCRGSPSPRT